MADHDSHIFCGACRCWPIDRAAAVLCAVCCVPCTVDCVLCTVYCVQLRSPWASTKHHGVWGAASTELCANKVSRDGG